MKNMYVCEHCGATFTDYTEALNHESNHKHIESIMCPWDFGDAIKFEELQPFENIPGQNYPARIIVSEAHWATEEELRNMSEEERELLAVDRKDQTYVRRFVEYAIVKRPDVAKIKRLARAYEKAVWKWDSTTGECFDEQSEEQVTPKDFYEVGDRVKFVADSNGNYGGYADTQDHGIVTKILSGNMYECQTYTMNGNAYENPLTFYHREIAGVLSEA